MQLSVGARRSQASATRDLTVKESVLKVYNEAELGVQRLRIPGELKDGGERGHYCTLNAMSRMYVH